MNRRSILLGIALVLASAAAGAAVMLSRPKLLWAKVAGTHDIWLPKSGLVARDCAQVFTYRGRLWMNDGYQVGNVNTDDLLVSSDGVQWQTVNSALPCEKYTPAGVHQVDGIDYMFFIDGVVRRTTDGVNFTTIEAIDPPPYVSECSLVSMGEKMHLIGRTHCYSSIDGSIWAHTPVPWAERLASSTILFNGRVYVMAGALKARNDPPEVGYPDLTSLNEVWSTDDPEDPAAWVNHGTAPWSPRMWPGMAVHEGSLYLFGGYDNTRAGDHNFADTWRMDEKGRWEQLYLLTSIPDGRHAPALYSHNGRLLLACGNSNRGTSVQSDIWELRWVG